MPNGSIHPASQGNAKTIVHGPMASMALPLPALPSARSPVIAAASLSHSGREGVALISSMLSKAVTVWIRTSAMSA